MLRRLHEFVRRRAGLLHAVSVVLALFALLLLSRVVPADAALAWVTARAQALGVWGPVVLGLLFVVLTLVSLPATPLNLAAGALFGVVVGLVTVSLASTVSAA